MDKLKVITYTVGDDDPAPEADQFLVSRTRAGKPGTVYHIAEVKQVGSGRTYKLSVYVADDLKPDARVEGDEVYVRDEKAWLLVWNSRRKKLEPDAFTHEQVFGDFLARHGSPGAVILVLRKGQVHYFGQWTNLDGQQAVLGWCKHADEAAFVQAWCAEPAGGELAHPLPARYGPADTETPSRLLDTVDDFMGSEALVLYYFVKGHCWETTTWGSARRSDPAAQAWLNQIWSSRPENQPLWDGTPDEPGGLSPATYAEVLARTRLGQNDVVRTHAAGFPDHERYQEYLEKCIQ